MKIIQLITRTEASKRCGVTLKTISGWIKNKVRDRLITKVYLCPNKNCKRLGVDPKDLENNIKKHDRIRKTPLTPNR